MSRTTACLSVSSLLAACSRFTEPTPADRLEDARTLWDRQGPADYIYQTRVMCFCGGLAGAGRWIEVTVMSGQVTRGRYADTGQDVETQWFQQVPTIEDLFENVEYFLAQDPDQLEVVYDPDDGHPTRITADIRVQMADDEYFLESRNLQAMLTGLGPPR